MHNMDSSFDTFRATDPSASNFGVALAILVLLYSRLKFILFQRSKMNRWYNAS